jgi:c-di-AMP phosphodiesterase-like protein
VVDVASAADFLSSVYGVYASFALHRGYPPCIATASRAAHSKYITVPVGSLGLGFAAAAAAAAVPAVNAQQ